MRIKYFNYLLSILLLLIIATPVAAYEQSALVTEFLKAYEAKDTEKMRGIVMYGKDKVPSEVQTLIYTTMSPNTPEDKKEAYMYAAELLAMEYKEVTGDFEPIKGVKRAQFEAKLSKEVVSEIKDGVHIIRTPLKSEEKHNYFEPDNIVIKAGETVSWVNEDEIGHLFASFSIIGKGGLFTPSIEPGKSWEYEFTDPGEYYYLCFIHKGMIGKVRVEE